MLISTIKFFFNQFVKLNVEKSETADTVTVTGAAYDRAKQPASLLELPKHAKQSTKTV